MNLGDVPHGAGLGVSLEVESAREGRQRGDVHPDATCRSSRTAQFGDVCNFEGSRQGLGAFGGPLTGGAGGSRYRSSSQTHLGTPFRLVPNTSLQMRPNHYLQREYISAAIPFGGPCTDPYWRPVFTDWWQDSKTLDTKP